MKQSSTQRASAQSVSGFWSSLIRKVAVFTLMLCATAVYAQNETRTIEFSKDAMSVSVSCTTFSCTKDLIPNGINITHNGLLNAGMAEFGVFYISGCTQIEFECTPEFYASLASSSPTLLANLQLESNSAPVGVLFSFSQAVPPAPSYYNVDLVHGIAYVNNVEVDTACADSLVFIQSYVADPGQRFDCWVGDSVYLLADSTAMRTSFTMPADSVLFIATYTDLEYTVTVTNGSASPAKSTYQYGELVTLSAQLPEGKRFNGWAGPDTELLDSVMLPVVTFEMPAKDVVFEATYKTAYELTTYNGINAITGGPEKIGHEFVPPGSTVTRVALKSEGFTFAGWVNSLDSNIVTTDTYTFIMPDTNYTITATYIPVPPVAEAIGFTAKTVPGVLGAENIATFVSNAKYTIDFKIKVDNFLAADLVITDNNGNELEIDDENEKFLVVTAVNASSVNFKIIANPANAYKGKKKIDISVAAVMEGSAKAKGVKYTKSPAGGKKTSIIFEAQEGDLPLVTEALVYAFATTDTTVNTIALPAITDRIVGEEDYVISYACDEEGVTVAGDTDGVVITLTDTASIIDDGKDIVFQIVFSKPGQTISYSVLLLIGAPTSFNGDIEMLSESDKAFGEYVKPFVTLKIGKVAKVAKLTFKKGIASAVPVLFNKKAVKQLDKDVKFYSESFDETVQAPVGAVVNTKDGKDIVEEGVIVFVAPVIDIPVPPVADTLITVDSPTIFLDSGASVTVGYNLFNGAAFVSAQTADTALSIVVDTAALTVTVTATDTVFAGAVTLTAANDTDTGTAMIVVNGLAMVASDVITGKYFGEGKAPKVYVRYIEGGKMKKATLKLVKDGFEDGKLTLDAAKNAKTMAKFADKDHELVVETKAGIGAVKGYFKN